MIIIIIIRINNNTIIAVRVVSTNSLKKIGSLVSKNLNADTKKVPYTAAFVNTKFQHTNKPNSCQQLAQPLKHVRKFLYKLKHVI